MSTINYASKEIFFKIVYYGCGLCGKTTNLQYIHRNIPSANKGNLVSLATETDRTLFFDFLPVDATKVAGSRPSFSSTRSPGRFITTRPESSSFGEWMESSSWRIPSGRK
jgi:GTPase SAR1 family protein